MNSIKTKSNIYTIIDGKAIGGVVIEPFATGLTVYVAWEWEEQAREGFFAIVTANIEVTQPYLSEVINYVANYGIDVTHLKNIRKKFPKLF